jgi:ubiquinone/menaquinone biosynthesis C-methylase UbiE
MNKNFVAFAGSIPTNYDQYMGPLFFEPYAIDLVSRINTQPVMVLEIACGTGRVTKHLRKALATSSKLIATDLNAGMLQVAVQNVKEENVEFKEADAQLLPFDDNSFDLVVCQFGFMFVPDKSKAFSEAYRVLKPNGKILFSTWDKLENNKATYIIHHVVAEHLSAEAAAFYWAPFSINTKEQLETLLKNAGFKEIKAERVTKQGTGATALEVAKGLILGTPAFNQITNIDADAPSRLVSIAEKELAKEFGDGIITTELNAWVAEGKK